MMATFTDPGAFAAHVAGYGPKIKSATPNALKAAALAATNDIRSSASGFHITRGNNGGKIPLKAGYDFQGDRAVIQARPAGAWTIIEKGTKAHFIGGQSHGRGRGRRRLIGPVRPGSGGGKVLKVPGLGRGFFAYVKHPGSGSSGHPWEAGVAKARVSAPRAFKAEIVKVFG
jgi:hypothetical protein